MPLFFTKTENRKAKQVLSGEWGPEVGYKERGSGGEYGGNILYTCVKMVK
jgi:hypothetical protein